MQINIKIHTHSDIAQNANVNLLKVFLWKDKDTLRYTDSSYM